MFLKDKEGTVIDTTKIVCFSDDENLPGVWIDMDLDYGVKVKFKFNFNELCKLLGVKE